jgi:hypothetical protein
LVFLSFSKDLLFKGDLELESNLILSNQQHEKE